MPLEAAESELFASDLNVRQVIYVSQGQAVGTVVKQDPEPGATVSVLSTIRLDVEMGEEVETSLGRTFYVRFRLPLTLEPGKLSIEVEDAHGKSVALEDEVSPGEVVEQIVSAEGRCEVRIYLDGRLLREDTV